MTLQELLDAITGYRFKVRPNGSIRAEAACPECIKGSVATPHTLCPVTAYCLVKTGKLYGTLAYHDAARAAEIPMDLATQIVRAADSDKDYDKSTRRALLALVVPEEVAQ